ncbi:unnamed protein product [Closterium sp. Naga37s-1]|nr:unnamed protein product [Closterium sp. Naga37s-1]
MRCFSCLVSLTAPSRIPSPLLPQPPHPPTQHPDPIGMGLGQEAGAEEACPFLMLPLLLPASPQHLDPIGMGLAQEAGVEAACPFLILPLLFVFLLFPFPLAFPASPQHPDPIGMGLAQEAGVWPLEVNSPLSWKAIEPMARELKTVSKLAEKAIDLMNAPLGH